MHKRLFFVGLLIVVLSLVAVAEEVITVSVKGEGIQVELAREAAKEFEAIYPCVDVKVIDTPKQAQDTLSLYLQFFEAESSKIDVYHVDCIWPGDWLSSSSISTTTADRIMRRIISNPS